MTRDELMQHLMTLWPEGTAEIPLIRRGDCLFVGPPLFQCPGALPGGYVWNPDARDQCPDCATWEGGLHLLGCDLERCGLCGSQYMSCDCERASDTPRVPYIAWNNICARCGEWGPGLFLVPNEEWQQYIECGRRREVLCRRCYEVICHWIETGPHQPPPTRFMR